MTQEYTIFPRCHLQLSHLLLRKQWTIFCQNTKIKACIADITTPWPFRGLLFPCTQSLQWRTVETKITQPSMVLYKLININQLFSQLTFDKSPNLSWLWYHAFLSFSKQLRTTYYYSIINLCFNHNWAQFVFSKTPNLPKLYTLHLAFSRTVFWTNFVGIFGHITA